MAEDSNIKKPVAGGDVPETWNDMPHPQDDLPVAVVRDYIIRDYRRMFEMFHKYKKLAALNIKQIEDRAKTIARKRKDLTQQLIDMQLKLEDRRRKINEMYDWLEQKETLINSLRTHCERQRDQLAVCDRNLSAQRQQIQSLLEHYDDADRRFDVLADAEDAWSPERWKQAMVELNDLRQNTTDLYGVIDGLPVGDDVRSVLRESAGIILYKTRRCYNAAVKIANVVLRKEFGAEIIPEDDETKDD